jgi:hypothetical protein
LSVAAAIATLGGLGRVRKAPGTIASFVTLIAAWLLATIGGQALVFIASIAAMALGRRELRAGTRDRRSARLRHR